MNTARTDTNDRWIDAGHHTVRVRVTGPDRHVPLVLVNGLGANLEIWEPLLEALPNRRLITFDAPGVGGSPTPARPLTMRQLATLVVELLDGLGLTQVDMLGVSLGGAIVQEVARRAPLRLRRLVLAATTFGWGSFPPNPLAAAHLANPYRYYSPRYFRRIAPTMLGGRVRRDADFAARYIATRATTPPTIRGFLWQMLSGAGWSSLPWLHRLTQPTLILAGDDDPLVSPLNGRLMASRIPNSRLQIVHGGGHLFLLDSATAVAPAISDFLDGQPGR